MKSSSLPVATVTVIDMDLESVILAPKARSKADFEDHTIPPALVLRPGQIYVVPVRVPDSPVKWLSCNPEKACDMLKAFVWVAED